MVNRESVLTKEDKVRLLRRTHELLSDGGWCQHALAKDVHGNEVDVESEEAAYMCLTGAVSWALDPFPVPDGDTSAEICDLMREINITLNGGKELIEDDPLIYLGTHAGLE